MPTATRSKMLHIVNKPFEAAGLLRPRGEVLDVTGWPSRRIATLIDTRWLAVCPAGFVPKSCLCGRQWRTLRDAAMGHHCEPRKAKEE